MNFLSMFSDSFFPDANLMQVFLIFYILYFFFIELKKNGKNNISNVLFTEADICYTKPQHAQEITY